MKSKIQSNEKEQSSRKDAQPLNDRVTLVSKEDDEENSEDGEECDKESTTMCALYTPSHTYTGQKPEMIGGDAIR